MNKRIWITLIALLLFALPCSVYASWEVQIFNSSSVNVDIDIYGEHLFWKEIHCTVSAKPDSFNICQMRGGICPVYAKVKYTFKGNDFNEHVGFSSGLDIAACYRTQFSIDELRGWNRLQILVQPK